MEEPMNPYDVPPEPYTPEMIPPPPRDADPVKEREPEAASPQSVAAGQAVDPVANGIIDSAVERMETSIAVGFSEVLREFRDKLAFDRFKEDQITRLHEELQAYRNDLIDRTARQILQGLIRLHDDLGRVTASLRQRPAEELTSERFFQQLAGFQDDVELLLGQHEVERFEVPGEDFDPRRQTAARTIPVDDCTLAGRIAERVRPGFQQGETLLQKERVAVYTTTNGGSTNS
jgi:molecular chaperone GrpE (heat shock protein)